MDVSLKIAGVCICAVCASLIIGDRHRSAAVLCSIAAFVILLGFTVGGAVTMALDALGDMYTDTHFDEYADALIKALGIAYITSAASEMCTAAGEGMLARAVGFCGRIELLALCLPMIAKLLSIASGMLDNI